MMKKSLLILSVTMIAFMQGCSEESVNTKETVKKEEVAEVVKQELVEPSGLKVTKQEFVEKFNESVIAQDMDEAFKIDDSLQSNFAKIGVIENENGYIEHLTYIFDTFAPATQIKLLLGVFSPKIEPENMPGIINFDFGLYEDYRDLEEKVYSGKAIIGNTVYELRTVNVVNRKFEITVRPYEQSN